MAWAAVAVVLAAAGGAAAWFLLPSRGGGERELLAFAPPDATVVGYLDVARLRRSKLYGQMNEKLALAEQGLSRGIKGVGLKFGDVDALMLAGPMRAEDSGVVVVRTSRAMGLDEVLEAPEKATKETLEGYEAAVVTVGAETTAVARISPRLFCFAPRQATLKAVLARAREGAPATLPAELEEVLKPVRQYEHFIALTGFAAAMGKAEFSLPLAIVSELSSIRSVGVGFTVGSSIDVEARARFAYADQAARLSGELQKNVREGIANIEAARPKLQGEQLESAGRALALLKSVDVSQAETLVCLKAHVDEKTASSLVEPFVAGMGRAQEQAQLARNCSNLKQIGLAAIGFETDRRAWPKGLAELADSSFLPDRALLVSPLDRNPPPLSNGVPCSYASSLERLGGPGRTLANPFNLPLAWDRVAFVPGKRTVLFYDGHVEAVSDALFGALMQRVELAAAGPVGPTPPLPKRPEPVFPKRPEPPVPPPKRPKQADTALVGGPRGGPFRLVGPAGEPMLGLRCTTRKWMREDCIGTVEPLFAATPTGPLAVLAKPGYAVGALEVDAATLVNAVRLVFMRLDGGKLNPADSYRSEWLGKPTGRPTQMLDPKGERVVGLCGRRGLVIVAIGLVTAADAAP